MDDITILLQRVREGGDRAAVDRIVSLLYPDLHRMAHARLAQNGRLTSLDTTAMIHETYERLCKVPSLQATCRAQFMAYASRVMRSVLVDFARRHLAGRRGGDAAHITLWTDLLNSHHESDEDIVRVHDALLELEARDPRLKQVVEMRYFGGFDDAQIAEALGISERTVGRDWERARLLLAVSIKRD